MADDYEPTKCGRVFKDGRTCERPKERWSHVCGRCWHVEKAMQKKDHARRAKECRDRATAARLAMPEAAKWCDRAAEVGAVHYLIPHVARSGMSRHIELFVTMPDGSIDPFWPDREPEQAPGEDPRVFRSRLKAYNDTFKRLSWSWKHRCFVVGGCGMDMVFATMDAIGHVFGHYDFGNSVRRYGLSRAE